MPLLRALVVAVLSFTFVAQPVGFAAGDEYSGGSGTNNGSGSTDVGGGNSQIPWGSNVPWCVPETGTGAFFIDGGVVNDIFVAPFPGCWGAEWQTQLDRCFTGFMVWRFYGTMKPGDQARVVTRSKVTYPDYCLPKNKQSATFFYPNATDATGYVASEVDGVRAPFGWNRAVSWLGEWMTATDQQVYTSNEAYKIKGDCTMSLLDPGYKNWMNASLKEFRAGAQQYLFNRYRSNAAKSGSIEAARVDINATKHPRTPDDITAGDIKDCSSILDYWGYKPLAAGMKLDPVEERDNTVVLGTCAVPLERPGRLYTLGDQTYHGYFSEKPMYGQLVERYSAAPFTFGGGDDRVTGEYKEFIAGDALGTGLPLTPFWPTAEAINTSGTDAWATTPSPDSNAVAGLARCEYQTLKPATAPMGFGDDVTSVDSSPVETNVKAVITATLPKRFTASGDLRKAVVPTTSVVMCGDHVCGTEESDPRILSVSYRTVLAGVYGYRSCSSRRELRCDFFAQPGDRGRPLEAWFFSPTSKGEAARLMVTNVNIRYIPKEKVTTTTIVTRQVVDPVTGSVRLETETRTSSTYRNLPPRVSQAATLLPVNTSRSVTGSVGG